MSFILALSFPERLMFGVVVLLGMFAGWRNATAGALVVCYCIVMGAWWGWNATFPKPVGFLLDATVLAVIYCKAPAFQCHPYASLSHQFCSLWLERSYWDRFVIASFGAAWLIYVAPISDDARWWPLWTIALAQYLAAGGETLQATLSARSKAGDARPDFTGMEFTAVGGGGYG